MATPMSAAPRSSDVAGGPSRPRRSPVRPVEVGALVALAAVLRLPAVLASRHLTVDDGVFGASAVAMRAGGAPFRDVFSSQGPLFLPLVRIADLAGLETANAPRLLGLVSGVGLVLAVHAAARQVAGHWGALLAATVVALTGSVVWVTGPIAADGPALALATASVALALGARTAPTDRRALAVGATLGAALVVKSLLLAAALPVGLVLLAGRRRHLGLAVGAAVAVGLAASLPWGLADVWDQAVGYHLEAAGERTPLANAAKVSSTLLSRDLPLVALVALALGTFGLGRRRRRTDVTSWTSDRTLLVAWLAATAAVLLVEHPLWRPHVSYLVPPVALLVARRPPPLRVVALAAIAVVPLHLVWLRGVLDPPPYEGDEAAVVGELGALPEGALAISDEPGLVWRAGRRTPGDLVDASRLRIDSGRITTDSLADAAADPSVCAVAVWSSRFGDLPGLPSRLVDAGYVVAARYGDDRVLHLRTDCDPPIRVPPGPSSVGAACAAKLSPTAGFALRSRSWSPGPPATRAPRRDRGGW